MTDQGTSLVTLTIQQRRCVDLVSQGLTVDQIAQRMGLTRNSVKSHLWKAYKALGAKNGPDAVRRCYERGIFPVERVP